MQPEARISQAIRNLINHRGGFAFKVWGNAQMMAGLPDIIACYHGVFIGIETKTPEGTVSTRQRYVHRRMRMAGAIVVVARTVAAASDVLDSIDATSASVDVVTAGLRAKFANAND